MNSNDTEELRGQIWSKTLKYLDFMAHQTKTGEEYYLYRDDKGRELAEDIVQLITQHDTAYREGLLEALPSQSKYKTPDSYKKAVRTLIATYGKDQPKREGTE